MPATPLPSTSHSMSCPAVLRMPPGG